MRPRSGAGRSPHQRPATFALTTDFGLRDSYVAELKGVLLRGCPGATLIDVTHLVPPQDVLAGAVILERAVRALPPGTVHIAVVDPGVGTRRGILIARIQKQWIVCPDNGLITWVWRRFTDRAAYELTWRPTGRLSATFHGRDIMAPVAVQIASGTDSAKLGKVCERPVLLDICPAAPGATSGQVLYVDHFGNAVTNIGVEALSKSPVRCVRLPAGRKCVPLVTTYSNVPTGKPLALIGSSGLLEISIRNGSAEEKLHLKPGSVVELVR